MPGKHAVPIVFLGKAFALIRCATPWTSIILDSRKGSNRSVVEVNRKLRESDERPWGRFEVLEERPGFKVKVLEVKPGARLSLQRHAHRGEHWVVVAGAPGALSCDRGVRPQQSDDIHIPPPTKQ